MNTYPDSNNRDVSRLDTFVQEYRSVYQLLHSYPSLLVTTGGNGRGINGEKWEWKLMGRNGREINGEKWDRKLMGRNGRGN